MCAVCELRSCLIQRCVDCTGDQKTPCVTIADIGCGFGGLLGINLNWIGTAIASSTSSLDQQQPFKQKI